MIVDLILDRKDNDADIARGFTHARGLNGELIPLTYNARKFYYDVLRYGKIGDNITRAMDSGTENDVKSALSAYIVENEYNPAIIEYINSVNWLS